MILFLFLAALVWFVVGAVVFATAKGVFHEMLAAALFSFGILFLGVASMIEALRTLIARLDKPTPATANQDLGGNRPARRDPIYSHPAQVDDGDIYAPSVRQR